MPAYLIAEHTITDPKKFEEYRVKVGPYHREARRSLQVRTQTLRAFTQADMKTILGKMVK